MKNIKMRPPVPLFNLFKKSSMILYLFLKAKSQAKAYIIKILKMKPFKEIFQGFF